MQGGQPRLEHSLFLGAVASLPFVCPGQTLCAPLDEMYGAKGVTAFRAPPFPGAVASLPFDCPGLPVQACAIGFWVQVSSSAPVACLVRPTFKAPKPHLSAGASAFPTDLQALSQQVVQQVAQQLWGSQHPQPCCPPPFPPVPVTSGVGPASGQRAHSPVPPPPLPPPSGPYIGPQDFGPPLPPSPPTPPHTPTPSSLVSAQDSKELKLDFQEGMWQRPAAVLVFFLESLSLLADLRPSLAAPDIPVVEQGLSDADALLGSQLSPPPPPPPFLLHTGFTRKSQLG